jgi:hypothetical protein
VPISYDLIGPDTLKVPIISDTDAVVKCSSLDPPTMVWAYASMITMCTLLVIDDQTQHPADDEGGTQP